MHLLIDGQALQTASSRQRGIGRYSSNLLRALAATRPNWRIEIVQNKALPPIAANHRKGLSILPFQPPLPLNIDYHEINERYYADWLTAQGVDAVLVLSLCEGWDGVVPLFCDPRPCLAGVVHDLIPLLYPEHYLPHFNTAHWYAYRFRQLLQCDVLLAISEATAEDVRVLGGPDAPWVVNIGGAVDPSFSPWSPSELAIRSRQVRKRFGLQREFLLYVGAADYRKNLHGAIHAFAALPFECRTYLDLAVVCRLKPAERASVEATAQQAGVASALRFIDSASDEELRTLYQICRVFFFPSLYEGLGLPVLEALHCGAPVVTSNRSSLPEYAGPYSWLGDPASPQMMAQALQQALAQPRDAYAPERQRFAQSFSWQKTAERACAAIERIVKQGPRPIPRRRRLAWVTSLTRNTTYLVEWLSLLAERFDIEVVATGSPLEAPEALACRYLILTSYEVAARHAALPYDIFVYQLDTPPLPPEMLALWRQFPGLVVRHHLVARDPRGQAAVCAARIEQAIRRHEQRDGLWRGFVVRCLTDYPDEADALLDSWAALRVQGQQFFTSRRQSYSFSSRSESAVML